jgi:glutathione S-transferase
MDSYKIADALEERYPSPSLHLNSDMQKRVVPQVIAIMGAIYSTAAPLIQSRLLNPPSQAFWDVTRKELFAIGPDPKGWEKTELPSKEVTRLLKEKEGPWFNGEEFAYVDIIWIAFLIFFQRIGDDVWEKFLEGTGDREAHLALLESARKWTERDSY